MIRLNVINIIGGLVRKNEIVKCSFTLPPTFLNCQIRVENALKTQVIRTVFSTRIPNSQSPLVIDNVLSCSETHLPVHQSIQMIYQRLSLRSNADLHCNALLHSLDKRRSNGFNSKIKHCGKK